MIDLWSQINHVVPFVCFLLLITRMRSSNLSRVETNLPYCLIAGVQCDDFSLRILFLEKDMVLVGEK